MLSHGGSGAFVGGTVVVLVIGVLLCVKKKKAKSGGAPPDLVKASHGQSPMTSSDTFDMLRNPLREDRGDTVGAQWSVRRKGPQPKRDPTSQESVDSFEAYGSGSQRMLDIHGAVNDDSSTSAGYDPAEEAPAPPQTRQTASAREEKHASLQNPSGDEQVKTVQGREVYNPYPNLAQLPKPILEAVVDMGNSSAESLPPLPTNNRVTPRDVRAGSIGGAAYIQTDIDSGHGGSPPTSARTYAPPAGKNESYIAELTTIDSGEMGSAETSVGSIGGFRSGSEMSEREWLGHIMNMRKRSSDRQILFRQPSARQDELMQVVRNASLGLQRFQIQKTTVAGKGSFGTVYRGTFKTENDVAIPVAVKELHANVSEKSRLHFLQEADLMTQLCHPNVVNLIGSILDSVPICIVMELCETSLLHRVRLVEMDTPQRMQLCIGAASGCEYLHGKKFVHRDLAARNVLVDDQDVPKIADFGLACPLADDKEYYKSSGGKIPLRWCAPECINFKKYSSASDVWAFGVVMWEVFACGEIPFAGVPNVILANEVCDGLRLGPPSGTPSRVYNLWLQMWESEASARTPMAIVRAELQSTLDEDDLDPVEASSIPVRVTMNADVGSSGHTYDGSATEDDPYEMPENLVGEIDSYAEPADSLKLADDFRPSAAAPPPPPRVGTVFLNPKDLTPEEMPPPPLPPRAPPPPPVRQRTPGLTLQELD